MLRYSDAVVSSSEPASPLMKRVQYATVYIMPYSMVSHMVDVESGSSQKASYCLKKIGLLEVLRYHAVDNDTRWNRSNDIHLRGWICLKKKQIVTRKYRVSIGIP